MFVDSADRRDGSQGRNLILCSDGTGNAGGKSRGTNVWRIYNAIERRSSPVEQLAFYDDGLGTEDWKPLKIVGGAFGLGFTRNLVDLYLFLALNHRPLDRIYLFGFSRGAYTVRTLAGIVQQCGLLDRSRLLRSERPRRLVARVIRAYRAVGAREAGEPGPELEALIEQFPELAREVEIELVGVFDTVDAVGVPMDELRAPIDWIWRHLFKRRLYDFRDRNLGARVRRGIQALSIDDERKTFHPNVWNPDPGRISQAWFAGAHSNVGGGYPRDAVSLVALEWMIGHAEAAGVDFVPLSVKQERRSALQAGRVPESPETEQDALQRGLGTADVHGALYNPRKGLGISYRYALRELGDAPEIHASVYQRIARGTGHYAPRAIPRHARVAYSASGPYARPLECTPPELAESDIDRVAALARARGTTYGVTVALAFVVAIAAVAGVTRLELPPAPDRYAWLGALVPDFAQPLLDLIAAFPATFVATAAVFGTLVAASSTLRTATQAAAFAGWQRALQRAGWVQAHGESVTSDAVSDERARTARRRVYGLRALTLACALAAIALFVGFDWPRLSSRLAVPGPIATFADDPQPGRL